MPLNQEVILEKVALETDGRYSGASHGIMIGHVTPEASSGGPIALVENGDVIRISAENEVLDLLVSEDELKKRQSNWKPREKKPVTGFLKKYVQNVKSAHYGAVTH